MRTADGVEGLTVLQGYLQLLAEVSPVTIFAYDLIEGHTIFTSRTLASRLGYSDEELAQLGPDAHRAMLHPDDLAAHRDATQYADRARPQEALFSELRFRHKNGSYLCLASWSAVASRALDGRAKHIVGVSIDVTEERRTMDALRASEELNRRMLEAVPAGILLFARDGSVVNANDAAKGLLGVEPGTRADSFALEWLHEDERPHSGEDPIARCLLRGESVSGETVGMRIGGGPTRWAVVTALPLPEAAGGGGIVTLLDITARKHAEARLKASLEERAVLLAQKMESLGVLAGGIAHDFNNLLTIVMGRLSLARTALSPGTALADSLDTAATATAQAQQLTRQLLTFSKGGAPVKDVVSLGRVAREASHLAASGSNAAVHLEIMVDLWNAEVDVAQISQALHNLVLNAAQAMPAGGRVRVCAENVEEAPADLPRGRYVRIEVRDQGKGIAPEVLPRVFDPFFTTKASGSGLGLAVVYSVVRGHGGHVDIASAPGCGTTVTLWLPATDKPLPAERMSPSAHPARPARVLLMDDQAEVRLVVGEMLATLGYEVESVCDGAEAAERYRQALANAQRFDAVMLDLTVAGGKGGCEAVRELLAVDATAKVVACSGYSDDPVMGNFAAYGFSGVLAKPFDLDKLSAMLRAILDAG
jgi:PAS domain S-box-containing protein